MPTKVKKELKKLARAAKKAAQKGPRLPNGAFKGGMAAAVAAMSRMSLPKKKKQKKQKNGSTALTTKLVSDGINVGSVITNTSVIIDKFPTRWEKVGNVLGSNASTIATLFQLYVNPGNVQLFPIFSRIASCYEQYRVRKLRFHFRTEEYAAVGSTISSGKIVCATNYDPDAPNFGSDTEVENYYNSVKASPFAGFVHDLLRGDHALKSDPLKNYYVNYSANTPAALGSVSKFYDIGNFQMFGLGMPATANLKEIGELYVEYAFDMIRPLQPDATSSVLYSHVSEFPQNTAAAATPLGTGGIVSQINNLGLLRATVVSTGFVVPSVGYYIMFANWGFSGANITAAPTIAAGSNILGYNIFDDSSTNLLADRGASTQTQSFLSLAFTVVTPGTGVNNTITFGGNTGLATADFDAFVFQLPVNFKVTKPQKQDTAFEQLKAEVARLTGLVGVRTPRDFIRVDVDDDGKAAAGAVVGPSSSSSSSSSSSIVQALSRTRSNTPQRCVQ